MATHSILRRALPWVITIGFFVVWQLVCVIFPIQKFILPSPVDVWLSFAENTSLVLSSAGQTLFTTVIGFLLGVGFGLVLGLIVGVWRIVYDAIYPLMIGFNSIPKVALVPVLVIWFGIGTVPAVLTAFASSFFPVMVNVATGLATMEPELQDVLRALGAPKWQIVTKVGIPRAMPYFFASLKVAITLAFIGSVVSETIAANSGIGWLMMTASGIFNVPLVFAGLAVVALMGIAMYEIFAVLERRVTFWATRSQDGPG